MSENNPPVIPDIETNPPYVPAGDVNVIPARHTPYMEASVGIENILKCLRVDYVWRLTHRDTPYKINRSGVRISLHVTF